MNTIKDLLLKAKNIERYVIITTEDKGCSVLGAKILLDDLLFVNQIHQSDCINQKYFKLVKQMLIDNGIDESRIKVDYGVID
jgi:hypothetical protein